VLDGMKPTLLGIAVGAIGALALGRVISSLIYAVKPSDPITFAAVTAVLCLIAFLACMVPAYRATKVDPAVALRSE
jgi:ABC-type antimicrobial peptide transport system permease subunit